MWCARRARVVCARLRVGGCRWRPARAHARAHAPAHARSSLRLWCVSRGPPCLRSLVRARGGGAGRPSCAPPQPRSAPLRLSPAAAALRVGARASRRAAPSSVSSPRCPLGSARVTARFAQPRARAVACADAPQPHTARKRISAATQVVCADEPGHICLIPGLKPALPLDLKPIPGTKALLRFDGARARARFVPQKAQARARARKLESFKLNPNLENGRRAHQNE